jgi:acyl dehydratase
MNLDKLLALKFTPVEYHTTTRDCMLYALGLGASCDPVDSGDLQFTHETGLRVFPSMVNVICHASGWIRNPELAIDWVRVLHGEQSFRILRPIEPNRSYLGSYCITAVVDKGAGKGAIVYTENRLSEKDSGETVSIIGASLVLRGDGGSGGTRQEAPAPHSLPQRTPDHTCVLATLPQQALLYRLSGDYNPIHADPAAAHKAGFDRPILHGQCTLGVATRAILRTCCGQNSELLRSVQVRFSSPVYPGETIATEIWQDGGTVSFRSSVAERGIVVLNNGRAQIGPP